MVPLLRWHDDMYGVTSTFLLKFTGAATCASTVL